MNFYYYFFFVHFDFDVVLFLFVLLELVFRALEVDGAGARLGAGHGGVLGAKGEAAGAFLFIFFQM